MSKRNTNFKLPNRGKMPKLDISVEKPSTSKKYNNTNSAEKFKNAIKKPSVPVVNLLLDDDDDEDLIFASQMVEHNNKIKKNSIATETESFSAFRRNVTSSTQIEHSQLPKPSDLFEEDSCDFQIDDDLLNVINDNEFNRQNDNFKKPKSPKYPPEKVSGINCLMDEFVFPNASTSTKYRSSSTTHAYSKDNCNEAIQVDKLIERLDNLNKETKKQNEQINQLNEKLLTKEGEVSVLRFEQRQLKQQIDTLRIQKITEADVIKKDWQDLIHELERKVNEKTIELNLKTNEVIKLKQSFDGNKTVDVQRNYKSIEILYRLNCRNSTQILNQTPQNEEYQELWVDIFKKPHENYTFLDKYYQLELDKISNVLSEIKLNTFSMNNCSTKELFFDKILESTTRALSLNSIKQFKIVKNETLKSKFETIENIENNQICLTHKNKTMINICQPTALYPNEKMIPLRRYIAALGLICQKLQNINLLSTITNENLNDCPKIALEKLIELLKDSPNYFGVLESIAFLLSSLAKINKIKPYLNLLKNLIFSQPNTRILTEISKCLLIISTNEDIEVLNLLCQKSDGYLCLVNDTKKKIRVQRDTSCILQIYGLILESAHNQNKSLNEIEWKLLLITCSNHTEFLRNCFGKYSHFIATNSNNKCYCYVQMCTSFIILFHLFLKYCIENLTEMKKENVRRICKLGSLLAFDIFCTNYRKSVLQKGGTSIKQRLYVICEWLIENFTNLGLTKEYQIAIQRIRSSSIFADSILNNEESEAICPEKGNIILRNIFDPNSFL